MLRLQLLLRQPMPDRRGSISLSTPPPPRPPLNSLSWKSRTPPSSSRLKLDFLLPTSLSRLVCNLKDSVDWLAIWAACCYISCSSMSFFDITAQLELGKPVEEHKPQKRVNGIFWILLINLGIYVADHIFQARGIKTLYLYHDHPAWYQFATATFCHFNWNHLSSNLFFLYIFGKLVEEEGGFALWFSYLITGVGANIVSWLVLPRNAVSIGASGAVFGLFAISVLVKMSWDWRKILEALILGQFVVERVMEAAQASTALPNRGYALQTVNHIAHLSGALIGVALIWLLSQIPSQPSETHVKKKKKKKS